MKLLVVVIDDKSRLVDLLDRFYDIGVGGATVIDTTGMGHHVPLFARFGEIADPKEGQNRTIFSVMCDELVEDAIEVVEEIVGDLSQPETGLVFILPVDFARGISTTAG